MQAAVHTANSNNLKIVSDFEIPKPKPNQVVIQVQASGVCHSDVYFLSIFPDDPREYIMGHEVTGVAVNLGHNVKHIKKGKRYCVLALGGCVSCFAKENGVTITPGEDINTEFNSLPYLGLGGNGGHAEYVVTDAKFLVPVPDNVPAEYAAVAADAGTTAWHAVKKTAGVKKGEKVLITGIGGLGLFAVQYAVYLGAEVYAVDMRPSSRELAIKYGAKQAFSLPELDAALAKGFSADVAIDFVSTDITLSKEYSAVSKVSINSGLSHNGRIVLVGIGDQVLAIKAFSGFLSAVHIMFSLYGTEDDLAEVLDLISKGHITPVVEKHPLHEANQVYDDLRANRILSRAPYRPIPVLVFILNCYETLIKQPFGANVLAKHVSS
ncbi:GroES-like protein [Irpex rosettiformis]|uniref:GroES-like protein n=1 Tax=Irpex rosettiformis TaxID=378272 RepID=A0ACB8U5C5_9APHY|nr:GroES-like protein [Irpex rosettiformis]